MTGLSPDTGDKVTEIVETLEEIGVTVEEVDNLEVDEYTRDTLAEIEVRWSDAE